MKKLLFIFLLNQSYISYAAAAGAPLEEAFSGVSLPASGPHRVVPVGLESGIGAPIGVAYDSLLGAESEVKYPYFKVRSEPRTDIEKIVNTLPKDSRKELNDYFYEKLKEFGVLDAYEAVGGKVSSMGEPSIAVVKRALDLSSVFARRLVASDGAARRSGLRLGTKQEQYRDLGFIGSYAQHEHRRSGLRLGTKQEQYRDLGFIGSYAQHEHMRRK